MKVNIGDRVRFLNEVGEGIVTKVAGKDIVNVLIEDGFELPTHINELVVIAQPKLPTKVIENQQTPIVKEVPKVVAVEEIEEIEGNDAPNVFFAFVPQKSDDILASKIDLFLINDCNYLLMYVIGTVFEGVTKYFKHGSINPNSKILQSSLHFEEIHKIEQFLFNFIFYKKGNFIPVVPLENHLKINHRKFTKDGCFEVNDFFDENALLYCLTSNIEDSVNKLQSDDIKEINTEKQLSEEYQKTLGSKYQAKPEPIIIEVDLHINHLLADCRGMTNSEIIEFQMKHFHTKMNEAISSQAERVAFIHGIGNGTLKNEVRKSLTEKYSSYKFQDASFKEYGYGATMVILK